MITGLVLTAASALLGAAHPNSFSWSNVLVRQGRVEIELRVQVLSVGEVVAGFDDDLDGSTDPDELAAAADDILRYCAEHYRVVPGAEDEAAAADPARALALDLEASRVQEGPLIPDPMNVVADWIDVRMVLEAPDDPGFERIGVHVDLFEVTSPGHRDGCTVKWNGEYLEDIWNFAATAPVHVFRASPEILARNAPAVRRFAASGAGDLASRAGLTLLAFGLLIAWGARRRPRAAAIASTGLLFAVAAFGLVAAPELPEDRILGSERFVDWALALGLVYLALEDLAVRAARTRWLEALVFGALIGLEEYLRLRPAVEMEASPTSPLAGHAVGALGAASAVAVALALLLARRGGSRAGAPEEEPSVAPVAARRALAVAALALGVVRLSALI